jgi:integrase
VASSGVWPSETPQVRRLAEESPGANRTADRCGGADRRAVGGWKVAERLAVSCTAGGPLRETNWKRSVRWREAIATIGRPKLRVHDLRHTAASVWLGSGADPKVVQRVLGHGSAAMTMDLYGHLIDQNLWSAAARLGDITGTRVGGSEHSSDERDAPGAAG